MGTCASACPVQVDTSLGTQDLIVAAGIFPTLLDLNLHAVLRFALLCSDFPIVQTLS